MLQESADPYSAWSALGVFIAKRRTDLGLSVEAASKLAGTSDTSWRQLESGKRRLAGGEVAPPNPRRDLLGRVARALRVSIDDLDDVMSGARRADDTTGLDLLTHTAADGVIDVRGLPAEDVEMIEQQVRRLRRIHGLDES